MIETMEPYLIGQDPHKIEHHYQWLYRSSHFMGSVVQGALSAIDIALWDLNGKILNQPVYKLLGGDRDRVPAYVGGGYYADGKSNEDLQKEMLEYIDMGYKAVKMKVGRISIKDDVKRVKDVRDAIGPDITSNLSS